MTLDDVLQCDSAMLCDQAGLLKHSDNCDCPVKDVRCWSLVAAVPSAVEREERRSLP